MFTGRFCNMRFLSFVFLLVMPHVIAGSNKLMVILVDGFRYDYAGDPFLKLTGFKKLATAGVRAQSAKPIYPTNSYPNWYTLMTGLYAESHGFVNNMMYDPEHNDFFLMAPNDTASVPHWWNQAEPLWITAEKNGKKAALFWWDGCQVEIFGHKPSLCKPYKYVGNSWPEVNAEMEKAISTSLTLLENDEIQLAQIYYEPVDFNGHKFGPESKERKEAAQNIDSILDKLQTQMAEKGLQDKVNLVIFSDHGMVTTDPKENLNVIDLNQFVDVDDIKYMIYHGAGSMILPEPGRLEKVYEDLKKVRGLNVYKKEEIPERYHLKNNRLTPPLLLVANKNNYIKGLDIPGKSIPTGSTISLGSHGYDPDEVREMNGIFFARGPIFRKSYLSQPLENVDVYNVLCDCLGIEPLPNNGSRTRINPIFIARNSDASRCSNCILITFIVMFLFVCLRS